MSERIRRAYAINQWKPNFDDFTRKEQHLRAFKVIAACGFTGIELSAGTGRWDPLGRPAAGEVLLVGATGYVESAQACGLHLLSESERDPNVTTSYGLGLLLAGAVEAGATEIVVGLGGSAVNDAGAGLLAALAAGPVDAAGYALPFSV